MTLKYWAEYNDVENILHRLEINAPDETLGDNVVTNSTFSTDTDWTKGTGWAIGSGVAEVTSSSDYLTQDSFTYLSGKTYEVTYTIVQLTLGVCRIRFFGTTFQDLPTNTVSGTFTEQITLTEDKTDLNIGSGTLASSFIVDNVFIREVIPASAAQEINAKVFLDNGSVNNPLEAIRGQGLRVDLEADTTLTFDDLYTEEEQTFSVSYIRDGDTLFNGWLNPEGLFQDYVSDKWVVSLDCVDGLSFLENLSFVQDTGLIFVGKLTQLEVIANCLRRTGVLQNININIDIFYSGLADTVSITSLVNLNAQRFIKDDNGTIMSCEEVLRSVLEPYAATITSYNGEWYIYKYNQLFSDTEPTFFRYDSDGVALSPTTKDVDLSYDLGSQINSFYPHHANSNQSIGIKRSIGAYRISYKYGLVQSLIDNIYLHTADGLTIDDWTVTSLTNMTLPAAGGNGVTFDVQTTEPPSVLNLTSDSFSVTSGLSMTNILRWTSDLPTLYGAKIRMRIILTEANAPNKNWYLNNSNVWVYDSVQNLTLVASDGDFSSTLDMSPAPDDGDIFLEIDTPFTTVVSPVPSPGFELELLEVSLSPSQNATSENNQVGEFHTFQRTTKPSAKVENTKEVFNADNPLDIYVGTIYESDETTPTIDWYRKGFETIDADKPLLQLMGEETLRMSARPVQMFSGSIYGYIPYLSVIDIDGIDGLFQFIEYSYDTKANITQVKMIEILGDELYDVDYQTTPDYGTTVKPTIKG